MLVISALNTIRLLMEEVKETEILIEPEEEVRKGERVIGEMAGELRKIYTLAQVYRQAAVNLSHSVLNGGATGKESEKGRTAFIKMKRCEYTHTYLMDTLWHSLFLYYDEKLSHLCADTVAVRAGWKIVVFNTDDAVKECGECQCGTAMINPN